VRIMEATRNAFKNVVGRKRRILQNNIKMTVREVGLEDKKRVQLARNISSGDLCC
jgi:hypothetical protein